MNSERLIGQKDKDIDDNETPVAYGSLYMDAGEKREKAEHQIRGISTKKPFMWFFDIVCTPNQLPAANNMATDLTSLIKELNPKIKDVAIVVGVTTKDKVRPAQIIMRRIASRWQGDKLEGLELKSGRRFLWVGGQPRE